MSALLKNEVFDTTNYETPVLTTAPRWTPRIIEGTSAPEVTPAATGNTRNTLRNVALFFAAPFIGLAYILAMPVVGFGMLSWVAGKALANRFPMVKAVALTFAAPFIGLAFVLMMPFAGFGVLAYVATHRNVAK